MDEHSKPEGWPVWGLAAEMALIFEGEGHVRQHYRRTFSDLLTSPQVTIIGLDEAGRGCVAGPVVAGATAWTLCRDASPSTPSRRSAASSGSVSGPWRLMRDSKRLNPRQREEAATVLTQTTAREELTDRATQSVAELPLLRACDIHLQADAEAGADSLDRARKVLETALLRPALPQIGVGLATCGEIESLNIWEATQLAIGRALTSLGPLHGPAVIFFDGKLPSKVPHQLAHIPQMTLVKADDRLRSVSAAGIVAKVTRDKLLVELESRFPHYGFARHKGYGTAEHFAAIRQRGLTPEHRPSFLSRVIEPTLF